MRGNVRSVQNAGLIPIDVDLVPFALCRSLITRPGIKGTVALIDLGASQTSVVIATDGVPSFVRIIPSGGLDLTSAIAQRLELPLHEANRLKERLGLATSAETIEIHRAVQIIYDASNEMLTSLRNTVNYFSNVRPSTPVQSVLVTGGAAALPGFLKALADFTRLPVSVGDPLRSVAVSKAIPAAELAEARSSLGVAIGLALRSAA